MEELDSDAALLTDIRSRSASRDIVQFVPFRKYASDGELLAKEVLAEIPTQLTTYMKQNRIAPLIRPTSESCSSE